MSECTCGGEEMGMGHDFDCGIYAEDETPHGPPISMWSPMPHESMY